MDAACRAGSRHSSKEGFVAVHKFELGIQVAGLVLRPGLAINDFADGPVTTGAKDNYLWSRVLLVWLFYHHLAVEELSQLLPVSPNLPSPFLVQFPKDHLVVGLTS